MAPLTQEHRVGSPLRAGAFILDVGNVIVAGFLLNILNYGLETAVNSTRVNDGTTLIIPIYLLSEVFLGYTPGKYVLGIQVGTDTGCRADRSRLFIRYAIENAAFFLIAFAEPTHLSYMSYMRFAGDIVGFVYILGCFFALGASRMAIHDKVAGTAVYRRKELEQAPVADEV